ncbi:hypothetical protein, partial [Enterobacter soli]|uniref:hypothetical protein n=1 Tax=Enterobacter soli TaxID=885040 RepID=UPI001C3E63E7
ETSRFYFYAINTPLLIPFHSDQNSCGAIAVFVTTFIRQAPEYCCGTGGFSGKIRAQKDTYRS